MKANKILTIIICLVVGVFLASMVGFMTNGFDKDKDNWGVTQLNDDNYFKVDNYVIKDQNSGDGYEIDVSDKGEIKVTGKNESGAAVTHQIQQITLPAGTYTFTSGVNGCSKIGYNLYLDNGSETTYYADFGNNTFTVAAEDTFMVYLSIGKDVEVNCTFKPVLVSGESAGDFFVINNK